MAITTTSVLSPAVQLAFDAKLLSTPTEHLIHNLCADRRILKTHSGDTLRMRRYNPLADALVPLGNTGETPPAQQLSAVNIDAKIQYYGTWIQLNEQVLLQNQESVLNQAAIRLGHCLRKSEDILTRDMLASTASYINCTGGNNGDSPTEITIDDVNVLVRTLKSNNAHPLVEGMPGTDKFGTAPVRDAYFALGHTDLCSELANVEGFLNKSQYSMSYKALVSEEGSVSNIRFLLSSIGSTTATSSNLGADIYNIFFVGQQAYAKITQNEYTSKFMYHPARYNDPLEQNSSAAMKYASACRIINDQWVLNARCTLAS